MGILVFLLGVIPYFTFSYCVKHVDTMGPAGNFSDSNNDMYVINAMVYQVGIVTNKTDNDTNNMSTTGNQETLTFYHNNGSRIDLSGIPQPLLTNVTAQSVVGVAPVTGSNVTVPWSALKQLAAGDAPLDSKLNPEAPTVSKKQPRHVHYETNAMDNADDSPGVIYDNNMFKRSVVNDTPVKIVKGSAVIPEAAAVQSIAIPPLLTLNNKFSEIPVPIPNTSIVHYAKVNTLVSKP